MSPSLFAPRPSKRDDARALVRHYGAQRRRRQIARPLLLLAAGGLGVALALSRRHGATRTA